MKTKNTVSKEKITRKPIRVSVDVNIIKVFKIACIKNDMTEYEALEQAICDWTIAHNK